VLSHKEQILAWVSLFFTWVIYKNYGLGNSTGRVVNLLSFILFTIALYKNNKKD